MSTPAEKIKELEEKKQLLEAEKAALEAQKALDAVKSPPEPDAATKALKELEVQKAQSEAKKAALEAEKARIEAQKALAAAKVADPTADATKDAEAQKKLVDAQKALIESQQQAWLAKYIGDVKAGPYTGAVEISGTAGTVEATLLASKAVRECAATIASDTEALNSQFSRVFVFEASKPPSFDRLINFRFRRDLIQQAFSAADIPQATPQPNEIAVASMSVATVAAGLGAVANLLGFFKTDTTVGGIEAKLDDALVVKAVAGAIRRSVKQREVQVPSLYKPKATDDAVAAIVQELATLLTSRTEAAAKRKELEGNADQKPRADQLEAAIALYDAFVTTLTTTDANGTTPLVAIAEEHALWNDMTGAAVLLVHLETSGGGYLVKKNFFSGLIGAPLFYMGGAAVSYILFDGLSGNVLAADVVSVYGKFVRASRLRKELLQ